MTIVRTVSVVVIASFLITALPKTTWANEEAGSSATVNLRAAIDRAAAQSAMEYRDASSSVNTRAAARARQMGGGGGSMMMVWTVVGTVTSLAATYFIVKEMRKQTDKVVEQ